jgi:hypothetical protein
MPAETGERGKEGVGTALKKKKKEGTFRVDDGRDDCWFSGQGFESSTSFIKCPYKVWVYPHLGTWVEDVGEKAQE